MIIFRHYLGEYKELNPVQYSELGKGKWEEGEGEGQKEKESGRMTERARKIFYLSVTYDFSNYFYNSRKLIFNVIAR